MAVRHLRFAPSVAEKDARKPFLTANIDRAIILMQYVLRSFAYTQKFRLREQHRRFAHAVHLDRAIDNFMRVAADAWPNDNRKSTDPNLVSFHDSSFRDYLAMCKRLAGCCNEYEEEAIQLIVREIFRLHKGWTAKVAAGKIQEPPGYVKPITTRNRMGKTIIAFARAFDVKLPAKKKKK